MPTTGMTFAPMTTTPSKPIRRLESVLSSPLPDDLPCSQPTNPNAEIKSKMMGKVRPRQLQPFKSAETDAPFNTPKKEMRNERPESGLKLHDPTRPNCDSLLAQTVQAFQLHDSLQSDRISEHTPEAGMMNQDGHEKPKGIHNRHVPHPSISDARVILNDLEGIDNFFSQSLVAELNAVCSKTLRSPEAKRIQLNRCCSFALEQQPLKALPNAPSRSPTSPSDWRAGTNPGQCGAVDHAAKELGGKGGLVIGDCHTTNLPCSSILRSTNV
jgi:hypothetical protein